MESGYKNLPNHLAIIMDGNGRWAQNRDKPRHVGHEAGLKTLSNIIEHVYKYRISHFSVYAFSSENWLRPQSEVKNLLMLFEKAIDDNFSFLIENKICFHLLGNISKFPKSLQKKIEDLKNQTSQNNKFHFYLAANYGSREELLSASNNLKMHPRKITESIFKKALYVPILPDVDLLIRTGGETRLSNFLLWQSAYAELYFTKVLWPDFNKKNLDNALNFFNKKVRKFGKIT